VGMFLWLGNFAQDRGTSVHQCGSVASDEDCNTVFCNRLEVLTGHEPKMLWSVISLFVLCLHFQS